ncbi:MAG TPA: hypothetical protein PK776_14120 [Flavobacterium sp.]|nr:hypothetical protein [Flavobacterium sp.]
MDRSITGWLDNSNVRFAGKGRNAVYNYSAYVNSTFNFMAVDVIVVECNGGSNFVVCRVSMGYDVNNSATVVPVGVNATRSKIDFKFFVSGLGFPE